MIRIFLPINPKESQELSYYLKATHVILKESLGSAQDKLRD